MRLAEDLHKLLLAGWWPLVQETISESTPALLKASHGPKTRCGKIKVSVLTCVNFKFATPVYVTNLATRVWLLSWTCDVVAIKFFLIWHSAILSAAVKKCAHLIQTIQLPDKAFRKSLKFRVHIIGIWTLIWLDRKNHPVSRGAFGIVRSLVLAHDWLMRGMTGRTLLPQRPSAHPTLNGESSLEANRLGYWKRQTVGNPTCHKPWNILKQL